MSKEIYVVYSYIGVDDELNFIAAYSDYNKAVEKVNKIYKEDFKTFPDSYDTESNDVTLEYNEDRLVEYLLTYPKGYYDARYEAGIRTLQLIE